MYSLRREAIIKTSRGAGLLMALETAGELAFAETILLAGVWLAPLALWLGDFISMAAASL